MVAEQRQPDPLPPWAVLAREQAGVVTRRQLLATGLTASAASWLIRDQRWVQPYRGIYVTFTGPQTWTTRLWAGVLVAGPGAAVAGRSALYLHGVLDTPPPLVHIAVPVTRHPQPRPGLEITRRHRLAELTQQAGRPARLLIEAATLDVAAEAMTADAAAAVVLTVLQRRRTTPDRLAAALARRQRHPWRALTGEVLADAATGVHSMLGRAYLIRVERAHGLPVGERNVADREVDAAGRDRGRRYRDVVYRGYRLVVELDGRAAHPEHARHRDQRRDNRLVLRDVPTLRYGWPEVAGHPCETAAEVGSVLRRHGWAGQVRSCGPRCSAATWPS